jgi:hypothetical protein
MSLRTHLNKQAGMVVHFCNSSCFGGRDERNAIWGQFLVKKRDPIWKITKA